MFLEEKPVIANCLKPAIVQKGETAKFAVETKGGVVKTVKWYCNGKEIDNPQTEQPDSNHFILCIPNAQKNDEADYKVEKKLNNYY